MPRKFAIRRIQLSETTFFQPLLEQVQRNARAAGMKKGSAQKAINLDRRVFVDSFYPALPDREFDVNLTVSGPDDNRVLATVRPISKPRAREESDSKNWRLHGSTIRNPLADPYRYDGIQPGDFLLMEFVDDADGNPGAVTMQILTRSFARANGLETDLDALFPGRWNMEAVSEGQMAALCARTRGLPVNPLALFDIEEEQLLEEALSGQEEAVQRVLRRRRNISREELLRTQQTRDLTGQLGERLTALHLQAEQDGGRVGAFVHMAEINAVAPYDFDIDLTAGGPRYVDTKATSGRHELEFHMSGAELAFAAASDRPYEIYRVSQARNSEGELRVSSDMRELAQALVAVLGGLPEGVRSDSVSINPALLTWSEPVALQLPEAGTAEA